MIYSVKKILISEHLQNNDYVRNDILTIQSESGEILCRIPYNNLIDYSQIILDGIKNPTSEGRSFSIDNNSVIFEKMLTNQLSDDKKSKADVRIVVHDPHFL
ncbi:MAG: HpaII family restriction endonuclease [Desulfobulbaceae bacterium]|nr:HpaII family restriction endonuclease [Desulfobulbaceae bacterium]